MIEERVVPATPTAPPGPSGLDAVLIDGCTFTESAGKLEPRPPLYCGAMTNRFTGQIVELTGNVLLSVPGGCVYVVVKNSWCMWMGRTYTPTPGDFFPVPIEQEPAYTGPITPAMWAVINQWWKP